MNNNDIKMDIIIDKIKSGALKKVVFLLGAGISVSSGIPDFRSDNGFYKTIKPELFTASQEDKEKISMNPHYALTIDLFRKNQLPLLELKRNLCLSLYEKKYKPTITHWFIRLCQEYNILHHIFTQNIDNMELSVGIDNSKITNLHGSINEYSCYLCNSKYPSNDYYNHIINNIRDISDANDKIESKEIYCINCHKPSVKPDIILFGEQLKSFDNVKTICKDADLLIISGTSLKVKPANEIPLYVSLECPRMIINNELPVINDFEENNLLDIFIEGDCDNNFYDMIIYLGWIDKMIKLVNENNICKKGFDIIFNDE